MAAKMSELEKASVEVQRAKDKFNRVLKKTYPISSIVEWDGKKHVLYGKVLEHDSFERVLVENLHSGARIWKHAYRLRKAPFSSVSSVPMYPCVLVKK